LGADVNKARDNGTTPLFVAALNGHEAVARALLEAGADMNKMDDDYGATLLSIAAQQGHKAVVKILGDAGAV
jgi:ankyrin repeat protein